MYHWCIWCPSYAGHVQVEDMAAVSFMARQSANRPSFYLISAVACIARIGGRALYQSHTEVLVGNIGGGASKETVMPNVALRNFVFQ
jgi:hypothetical protein